MGQLFNTIQELVSEERYVVGQHASERLEERGIMEWQAVAGPDGTEFKAVWSHLAQSGVAKLVTVHFFD